MALISIASRLVLLDKAAVGNYWAERIAAQLHFTHRMSRINNGRYNAVLDSVLEYVLKEQAQIGAVTASIAEHAETMLKDLHATAKTYRLICVAHAHIDMNWMWRWDETVAITLDTFRTILDLMDEYPEFTFSQSQASVYKIVEDYGRSMLADIKRHIRQGRWEVTASTWVEADKNMPNGESMARHLLYTKRYLSNLLDIKPKSLNLDFEPDTFGHSINVPEILSQGGVKYYYHCRGAEGHFLERWTAPSGRSIIVYREPFWYNASIEPQMVMYLPDFCRQYGLMSGLKVYGVGNHGGGPTRRDIEKIIDMNTWPVFPSLVFGSYKEFFGEAEKAADSLPKTHGERNFIFTGCYTSQARIKAANRIGEAALNEAETFSTLAALNSDWRYGHEHFFEAWRHVLFNQFHDIIPGSGVADTREHARGLFQETMAIAGSNKKGALEALAANIYTEGLIPNEDIQKTTSEGAGVGFGVEGFLMSQSSRGAGLTRIFHVFNPGNIRRCEPVKIVLWDWDGDLSRLICRDDRGEIAAHQLVGNGFNHYWGHSYVEILLDADVEGYGYATYIISQTDDFDLVTQFVHEPRLEAPPQFVFENELIRAEFDPKNCTLVAFKDKRTEEALVARNRPSGLFRLIQEDPTLGMTSWRVGRHMAVSDLIGNIRVLGHHRDDLQQRLTYEMEFGDSKLKVTISLDKGSTVLNYDVTCDWQERAVPKRSIPQLGFYVPTAYKCDKYVYDVPFGTISRQPQNMDVPGNSWMLGEGSREQKSRLMLITDSKYGFRGFDNTLAVSLIRSSYDPDPYPEFGIHTFRLGLCATTASTGKELIETAYNYCHPLTVLSGTSQKGEMPLRQSFMQVEAGSVAVSAVKMPESQAADQVIVRLYETEGSDTEVVLGFLQSVKDAALVDLNEQPLLHMPKPRVNGSKVALRVGGAQIVSIKLVFD
ncbi:MAG: alpha-mannosidase [Firmicutes bacterium]|nr:alpha-mannosidase [Bacillota bacterium]